MSDVVGNPEGRFSRDTAQLWSRLAERYGASAKSILSSFNAIISRSKGQVYKYCLQSFRLTSFDAKCRFMICMFRLVVVCRVPAISCY